MARPTKHNADYFSHDAQMRNDIKVKALRRKYGHEGYSFWNMMLEHLTECEYFEYEWNEFNIELLSADFDIDSEKIVEMVEYCIKLELLQIYYNLITCDNLTNRLEESVLTKRKGYSRNNSLRISRIEVITEITPLQGVNDGFNGQSKVKESKVKEIKEKEIKEKESIGNESIGNESKEVAVVVEESNIVEGNISFAELFSMNKNISVEQYLRS